MKNYGDIALVAVDNIGQGIQPRMAWEYALKSVKPNVQDS